MHSPSQALDAAVEAVARHKHEWARVPPAGRRELLTACLASYRRTASDVVAAGCAAKGIDPRSHSSGEEWMSGPAPVIRHLRMSVDTLSDIERSGCPSIDPRAVSRTPTGELAVTVFPRDRFDRLMYPRTRIDVWMEPDVDERGLPDTIAPTYRADPADGTVVVVLGAGNVASIAPTDVISKLIGENSVVVLKMHPVNEYLGPLLERGFEPLIARGFLRIVYGGVAEGQQLIHHPLVDAVHMTGSTAVHDRIVWGETADEQAERRAAHTPLLTKRITSELGCVTPTIVVPGRWSEAEVQYQAENVATMVAHSASCTCTSARLLVTWRDWPQRQVWLDRIAAVLAEHPSRLAYYPGAAAKYERFVRSHPHARCLGSAGRNHLACATVYDVGPDDSDHIVFREEAWSPVIAETALAAGDEGEFVDKAVRFCNDKVLGTLSVNAIVDPRTHARLRSNIDRAVQALKYGTVSVNHWSAVSFGLGAAPWGAYPGQALDDVGSGIGFVHNTLLFDRPLKSVLWGPFTSSPKPGWFTTHRRAHVLGRKMAGFEASPSLWRLASIAAAAYRG